MIAEFLVPNYTLSLGSGKCITCQPSPRPWEAVGREPRGPSEFRCRLKCCTQHVSKFGKLSSDQGLEKVNFSFFFFKFFFIYFISWRLITLQYCSGFCHESAMELHVFPIPIPLPPPSPSHTSGSSQCTSLEHLSHASNLGW